MNQCYNYKKFVGLGIIYKSDENNYICIGSFKKGEKAYPMSFPNDGKSRQDHVIQQILNTINSINPERQAKAVQEMLKQLKEVALAREGSYAPNLGSNMGSIEASWKPESNSNILKQKDYSKESIAKI